MPSSESLPVSESLCVILSLCVMLSLCENSDDTVVPNEGERGCLRDRSADMEEEGGLREEVWERVAK